MKAEDAGLVLKRIDTALNKQVETYFTNTDITLTQWHYLNYIYDRGGKNVLLKDLKTYFKVAQPTVVGVVDRMETKGYLYLEWSSSDTHSKTANLTEAGINLYHDCIKKKKNLDNALLEPLTDTERQLFLTLLQKIDTSLNDPE